MLPGFDPNFKKHEDLETDGGYSSGSWGSTPYLNLSDLQKDKSIHSVINSFNSYFVDIQTQTDVKSGGNKRTIFSRPFDHTYILDRGNSTVQMPNSDVILTLPRSLLDKKSLEVSCSSFGNLLELRKNLGVDKNERLASPVVEYSFTGYTQLDEFACVEMPFVGDSSYLKVWKFLSDEGLNTHPVTILVPRKSKLNTELDLFYDVDGKLLNLSY